MVTNVRTMNQELIGNGATPDGRVIRVMRNEYDDELRGVGREAVSVDVTGPKGNCVASYGFKTVDDAKRFLHSFNDDETFTTRKDNGRVEVEESRAGLAIPQGMMAWQDDGDTGDDRFGPRRTVPKEPETSGGELDPRPAQRNQQFYAGGGTSPGSAQDDGDRKYPDTYREPAGGGVADFPNAEPSRDGEVPVPPTGHEREGVPTRPVTDEPDTGRGVDR